MKEPKEAIQQAALQSKRISLSQSKFFTVQFLVTSWLLFGLLRAPDIHQP